MIERAFLLTVIDREIERTKSITTPDAIAGMKHIRKKVAAISPTIDLVKATKLLYENPDAKLENGEKLILIDKASDILNGAFTDNKHKK